MRGIHENFKCSATNFHSMFHADIVIHEPHVCSNPPLSPWRLKRLCSRSHHRPLGRTANPGDDCRISRCHRQCRYCRQPFTSHVNSFVLLGVCCNCDQPSSSSSLISAPPSSPRSMASSSPLTSASSSSFSPLSFLPFPASSGPGK